MAEQVQSNNSKASDEIDLGQLLELVKKGFHNLGNFFLRIFIYLRRNTFKIIGLIVLGVAISLGLNELITKKLKTDVIVRPNFDSKNYLYDVVHEIESNLKSKNTTYFEPLGIDIEDLNGFKISIEAIEDEEVKTEDAVLNEMKYLEVLESFKEESFVLEILRSELTDKSVLNHKISFSYKDSEKGPIISKKLIDYINTNEYFNDLKAVHNKNAHLRIERNTRLIAQIDDLIANYSKTLVTEKQKIGSETIYLEQENGFNLTGLLGQKNIWAKEIEEKNLELAEQTGVIRIINLGKTQEVRKPFFNQTYFLIPTLLVVGFLLFSFFQYLNRKAKEIE